MSHHIEFALTVIFFTQLIFAYFILRHLYYIETLIFTIESQDQELRIATRRHFNFWDNERDELITQIELLQNIRAQIQEATRPQQPHRRVKQERNATPGPSQRRL